MKDASQMELPSPLLFSVNRDSHTNNGCKIHQIKKVKVHDPPQPWFISKVYTAQFNTPLKYLYHSIKPLL